MRLNHLGKQFLLFVDNSFDDFETNEKNNEFLQQNIDEIEIQKLDDKYRKSKDKQVNDTMRKFDTEDLEFIIDTKNIKINDDTNMNDSQSDIIKESFTDGDVLNHVDAVNQESFNDGDVLNHVDTVNQGDVVNQVDADDLLEFFYENNEVDVETQSKANKKNDDIFNFDESNETNVDDILDVYANNIAQVDVDTTKMPEDLLIEIEEEEEINVEPEIPEEIPEKIPEMPEIPDIPNLPDIPDIPDVP